jgi:hypothetical protein
MERPKLPGNKAEKLITFIYYKDLQKGIDFYGKTLGFPMEIDQGWCKIYRISEAGYIGVVDEAWGDEQVSSGQTCTDLFTRARCRCLL